MACPEWEERIWTHADGERSPEVEEHVRSCAECAYLLDEASRLTIQDVMAVRKRHPCPRMSAARPRGLRPPDLSSTSI